MPKESNQVDCQSSNSNSKCLLFLYLTTHGQILKSVFQALHEQLAIKEGEIESIKQLGSSLTEIEEEMPPPAGGASLSDACEALNQQWADLDHKVSEKYFFSGAQDLTYFNDSTK